MPEVSVTSKGQVTIPKRIRDELGITTGSKVKFDLVGGEARMRPINCSPHSRIEDGPSILNYSGPRIPIAELQGVVAARRSTRHARG